MLPLTAEWVEKAEGDFTTSLRELRARKSPNYDSACFHAQQCAEKYLKGLLQQEGIAFPRTHSLVILLDLILPLQPSWSTLRGDLNTLTASAVEVRYPGETADKADAKDAVRICRDVRDRTRKSLGLPAQRQ
jgi:HEPN domain-containing protein